MQTYYIGRYYFNALFRDLANQNFLNDLTKDPYLEKGKYVFAIGNINVDHYENHEFIRGTFGRIRRDLTTTVYDRTQRTFSKLSKGEEADIMLEFIIHHKTHIIFVEKKSSIEPEYFADMFCQIYTRATVHADMSLDFLIDEADVYEEIKKWRRVEKVVFKGLRPTNPSSLDYFEDIDKLLKESNAEKAKFEFDALPEQDGEKKDGINYESLLVKQSLALSSHGYGKAELKGKKGDSPISTTTGRFKRTIELDFTNEGVLTKLKQVTEEISTGESHE